MSLIDQIQTDKEAAQSAVADMLQAKVFDFLDNYKLDEEVVKGSVKKDKHGHILAAKTVPDKDKTSTHGVVQGSVKKDAKDNVLSFKTEEFDVVDDIEYIGEAFDDAEFNLAEERRESTAFKFTHIPGDEESEKKLQDLKDSVKGTSQRVLMKGRLGKDNPNAQKYKDAAAAAKKHGKTYGAAAYQTIRKADAKHFDIYVHNK